MTRFPKGSEWRKWDYHVHTPASWYYSDRSEGAFQKIAAAITSSDCAALGINDYLTIDGYLKIRPMVSKPVFPVVEFRMTTVLIDKSSGGGPNLNFHLLFTNEDSYLPKIKAFLGALQFVDFRQNKRNLTPDEIIDFGKQILPEEHDAEKLRRAALEKIKFDFFDVVRCLEEKGIRDRCLIILPYDEHGGIDGINPGDDGLHKSGLIKAADLIGSSSQKEREYFLGQSTRYTKEQFKLWVGKPKPIIKGGDAHRPEDIGKIPVKADGAEIHCWIKADLTFEGLKQILYEPEERIYIGSAPPDNKDKSKVISSIGIRNAGQWFEDQKIEINRDLVTVIGGKGSGKTALVDFLALAGGDFDSKNGMSFLSKAQKELVGTKILLQWEDGSTESEFELGRPLVAPATHKVRYLSQSFVESLCSFDRHAELEGEIEDILFQYVPGTQRLGAESFDALKRRRTEGVQLEIDRIGSNIKEINAQIYDLRKLIESRGPLVQERDKLEKDITELHKQKPKPSTEEERKVTEELKKLAEQRAKIASEIEKLRINAAKLEILQKKFGLIIESVDKFNLEASTTLADMGEADMIREVSVELPARAREVLENKRRAITSQIAVLEGSDGKAETGVGVETLAVLDLKIADLNKRSSLESQKRDRFMEFNKRIAEHTLRRDALTQKIADIDKTSRKELDSKSDQRKLLFLSFFEKLEEKRKNLEQLYGPLNLKAGSTEEGAKVQFYAKFTFDVRKFSVNAEGLFDARKSIIRGEQAFAEVGFRFWEDLSKTLPITDAKPIDGLIDILQQGNEGIRPLPDQIRNSKTSKDVADWLFSLDYYDVEYGINYEGTDLDKLSPGKKGVVLLLIYLTIDKDYRPLIIDQPEENLDNRSVYTTLVEYFKKAKRNRQVIIVTHNANLVVNGDAEQVIVANFEKDCVTQRAKIKYQAGSLENSEPVNVAVKNVLDGQGIRQHVCELLEGGEMAFAKREEKYGF